MTSASTGSNDRPLHCVVGSGPAGVACAHALLQRGARVRLIDGGVSLEPARVDVVSEMRQTTPDRWSAATIAQLKAGTAATRGGIPLKLVYGSDFPYRECDDHLRVRYENVAVRPSLATGGLSAVWGAAMLPYVQRDTADWPFPIEQLAVHYRAAADLTGLSARTDDLEQCFPLHADNPVALKLSQQATRLLNRLERSRDTLRTAGIHFGQARLAVQVDASKQGSGCVYCGLCMYGCPYGCIYSSDVTLRDLQKHPDFEYEADVIVTRVSETLHAARLEAYGRQDGAPASIEAARVYLAAGAIPTTQILLRSRGDYERVVWMKDSQYFLVPLAMLESGGDVEREALHTLSQLFIEIFDPAVSPHTVHLQVYSYNDLIGQAVRASLGPAAKMFDSLARQLERRLLIVQGYLHSDHSSRIGVTLKAGNPDALELKASRNAETSPTIRRVMRKLFGLARHTSAVPIPPMLQMADAGRGFHTGGTFPMRQQPTDMESDTLGRPHGWQRVHVVDSTVLPSIPATTITFSVMANAHRIGWHAASLS
jgi:choline dehydrogenase-like flavoprotein